MLVITLHKGTDYRDMLNPFEDIVNDKPVSYPASECSINTDRQML